eukprot:4920146-Pyramimonas_sp.AAC.1
MDNGADVDYELKDGKTALIHAAEQERLGCARALVERGALPDRESANGVTPLIAAVAADKSQVTEYSGEGPNFPPVDCLNRGFMDNPRFS